MYKDSTTGSYMIIHVCIITAAAPVPKHVHY